MSKDNSQVVKLEKTVLSTAPHCSWKYERRGTARDFTMLTARASLERG